MHPSVQKIIHFPITKMVLGIAFCFSTFVGTQNLICKPIFYSVFPDKNIANPIIHLASFFVLYYSYCIFFRLYEKRAVHELSLRYLYKEMFGGFALGFVFISTAVFLLYIWGYYHCFGVSTSHYSVKLFTTLIVAAFVEDLFHRGLILREIENWLGTHIALLIVMLIETSHIFNPNANVMSLLFDLCWGFTLSMLFVYTKRVWLPFFFHLGWNFAQPFYGSNLTGLNDLGTIIQSKFEGPDLFTGGAIGIEGSIFTMVLLLALGVFLYRKAQKEGKIIPRKRRQS